MRNNSEPTKRRRFDVPISSAQSPRQSRATKQYRPPGRGTNRALIDAGIVVGTTLAITLLLLGISGQISDTTAGNLIARSAAPLPASIALPQPTPQSSLAAPTPSSQPIRSPTPDTGLVTLASATDDAKLQATVEKRLRDDASFSALGITATVNNGQVALSGTVPTDELKDQVEKLVRAIKGVKDVDNQVVVIGNP